MFEFRYFAGFWLVVLSYATAQAQPVQNLIASGQHEAALHQIDAALQAGQRHPDLFLLRGYALSGLGHSDAAAQSAQFAKGTKARFDYFALRGQVQAQKGKHNSSLFWYRRALDVAASSPQKTIARQMLRFNAQQRRWVWGAQFNLRQSDNINFSTTETEVMIGGLAFKLAEENRARAGLSLVGTFSGDYKVVNTPVSLLSVGAKLSFGAQRDVGLTARNLGVGVKGQNKLGRSGKWTSSYGLGLTRYMPIGAEVTTERRANVGLGYSISPKMRLRFDLSGAQYASSDFDYKTTTGRLSLNWNDRGNHAWSIGLRQELKDTEDSGAAARAYGIGVSATPNWEKLPVNLSVFGDLEKRDYSRVSPLMGTKRKDETLSYGVTVSPKEFTVMGMVPSLTVKSVTRSSNAAINSATAREVYFGLRNSF